MTLIQRNSLCGCGSGLRFKACCGKLAQSGWLIATTASTATTASMASISSIAPTAPATRELALQKHLSGELFDAIALYDDAVAQNGYDWDVLHMRGVALYQLGLIDEAHDLFSKLLSTPAQALPGFFKNYRLVLSAVALQVSEWDMFTRLDATGSSAIALRSSSDRVAVQTTQDVRVAVVMPVYNHAVFVAAAIESVMAQSRLPDEMIVIDDGSTDDSVGIAREALTRAPFSVQFIARGNRGAHATLNEAIALANCEWIQPLNSDDRFPTERIERCIAHIASRPRARWGYMRVDCIDGQGSTISSRWDPRCREIYRVQDNAANTASHSHALLLGNASISTGNLFFRKTLWRSLNGFADFRYNHDWDFCLRAAEIIEPVVIDEPGYFYRVHARNTISESAEKARTESAEILARHIATLGRAETDDAGLRDERVEIAYAMDLFGSPPLTPLSID